MAPRAWDRVPLRPFVAWNDALKGVDAGRTLSRRRAVLDVGLLALLGAGLVELSVHMGRWNSLPKHGRDYLHWLIAAMALYGLAAGWIFLRRPNARWALAVIMFVALAARLALVQQAPTASNDSYRYVWDGRVQAHEINPYRYPPNAPQLEALQDDAIYKHMNRLSKPTIYPPVAQHVFRVLYLVHPNSVTWTKLAFTLLDLATIGLMAGLLLRLDMRPERVLLYAWHPLLILEVGHNGHVDVVAIFFLVLALRARFAQQATRTGILLACAGLVKFYAVVALPALLFRRWRKDAQVIGSVAMTALLAYLPFLGVGRGVFGYLHGYATEEGLGSGRRFFLLTWTGRFARRLPHAPAWPGAAPIDSARAYQAAIVLVMAALALWCWRVACRTPRGVFDGAALLYATLLVLSTPSYPWYTLLLLALVPFVRGRVLLPALAIVSGASLLYLQWWWIGGSHLAAYLGYGTGAVCLGAVALWSATQRLRRRLTPSPAPPGRRASSAGIVDISGGWNRDRAGASSSSPSHSASLYDNFTWVYAFCRERLFSDHSRLIDAALWPDGPTLGSRLIEIGCGPGLYARRLAARYPTLDVVGIDRSTAQVRYAKTKAVQEGLSNCTFQYGDALRLGRVSDSTDAVIASRLFTILPQSEAALAEMHRVLRPGGRCFIAEPSSRVRATAPLRLLWFLDRLFVTLRRRSAAVHEPECAIVMTGDEFRAVMASQDWESLCIWHDRHYHFALCTKAAWADEEMAAD